MTSAAVRVWMSSPLPERVDQHRVLRHMREQAQLDLRVVRDDQLPAVARNERRPDFAPQLRLDGNVLQVGIGRRQPSGGRAGLVEAGVDAAGDGVHQGRQRVDIGAFELGELPVFQHLAHDFDDPAASASSTSTAVEITLPLP